MFPPAPLEIGMPRYMIERDLPGAGALSTGDLAVRTRRSNGVVALLGRDVVWIQSFVTADKLYCIYDATTPQLVAEHARRGGFPCDRIAEVRRTIDPTTG
jgi:Nickel responsive protein SCO4226-like